MFSLKGVILVAICTVLQFSQVFGHGMLLHPPARGTAWRFGFNTPKDYSDNAKNCGGFGTQWNSKNKGKCGICGDRWDGVRENETPGKYATGTIVANYTEGQVIDVQVRITANHKGWVEFRLCENNNPKKDKTQECFDKHLLTFVDSGKTRKAMGEGLKVFFYRLQLPQGVTCTQCILQWYYNAGNSWGIDPVTKKGCVGCGPQETFWGCSDIAISSNGHNPNPPSPTREPNPQPSFATTEIPTTTTTTPARPVGPCHATGPWTGDAQMNIWCQMNCAAGYCPPSHCTCDL